MLIGIDVGGTHTDAVLLNGRRVEAATKALTTADVTSGIVDALDQIMLSSGLQVGAVNAIMIGTTQFTNAIIERKGLAETAILRLGLPSGRGLPPMIDWPDDIAAAMGSHVYMIEGGTLYDGEPLAPLDETAVIQAIERALVDGVRHFAVSGAFSPMRPTEELWVRDQILMRATDAKVSLSHTFGRLGLLERENAAALNASLLSLADDTVTAFITAVTSRGFSCPVFISQNDGTVMNAETVKQFPALTFSSGPTNSLRGAMILTGETDAVVIDIGGTTADIGILKGGFPRESNLVIEVGGVRTNFRMPDIEAVGLGGGSLVTEDFTSIGPQSVGHRLVEESRVFGGAQLTATDIIVAAGVQTIGDPAKVADLPADGVRSACRTMMQMLDRAIDRMKPSSTKLPAVLVGGGAILATGDFEQASSVIRPENAGVANAIGAAAAQVGGESERILSYASLPRTEAIDLVTKDAVSKALASGADAHTLKTLDIEESEVPYMGSETMRVRVKVVGDLDLVPMEGRSGD